MFTLVKENIKYKNFLMKHPETLGYYKKIITIIFIIIKEELLQLKKPENILNKIIVVLT